MLVAVLILLRRLGGNGKHLKDCTGSSWSSWRQGSGRDRLHRQPWLGSAPQRHSQGSRTFPQGVLPQVEGCRGWWRPTWSLLAWGESSLWSSVSSLGGGRLPGAHRHAFFHLSISAPGERPAPPAVVGFDWRGGRVTCERLRRPPARRVRSAPAAQGRWLAHPAKLGREARRVRARRPGRGEVGPSPLRPSAPGWAISKRWWIAWQTVKQILDV